MVLYKLISKYRFQSGPPTQKETEMATSTPTQDTPATRPETAARDAEKLHTGPVARLLSKVSNSVGTYADYQMERGVWRKLAL